ncbi:bifunctional 5,10-methylenetetrahydrofolate dehydrogenase/5,10-methenyltetrahydrofolate cyclohydrolase [Clostridia bacterium]|nr:bifunctional 5,10-methylenetetrahydrofolate dehydrogenase/5,10-methenyltetrahydrofolate cyclohydrolase [Clostridia bacterium]
MANIIDGKLIAKEIREKVAQDVKAYKEKGIEAKLAVILVGDDPASVWYAKSKKKAAEKVGILYDFYELPKETKQEEVETLITKLNQDETVHGIMVELPLPAQIDKDKIMGMVDPKKDVDGVNPINRGYILQGAEGLFPATPESCIECVLSTGVELSGKKAVIVGRGETVGKPLVFMLLKYNPTITICHSRTKNLAQEVKSADVVIAAVGKAGLITGDMLKEGAIVVDAGVNEIEGGGGYVGDVDYQSAEKVASYISPVPGGVGSLTTVLLFRNLIKGMGLQGR